MSAEDQIKQLKHQLEGVTEENQNLRAVNARLEDHLKSQDYVNRNADRIFDERGKMDKLVRQLSFLSWKLINNIGMDTREQLINLLVKLELEGRISLDRFKYESRHEVKNLNGFDVVE